MTTLYLVIPCYNEEAVLPETSRRLLHKISTMIERGQISPDSRITFVDDGSRDRTWELISQFHRENRLFSGIKLSRNRGHQNALLCGLMTVKDCCDCAISLDADLQDDIEVIDQFVAEYERGADVVYGVRASRETDTAFKRMTAEGFYKVMKKLGVDIVFNHADYRLMSRRALDALGSFREVNLFLRGIVPQIGFRSAQVTYERHERFAGESKYPLKKMLAFAWDGITSFSVKPLRFIASAGIVLLLVSALFILLTALLLHPFTTTSGLYWLITGTLGFALGIALLALGVVGQYIGKIYAETKARPRYIVDEFLDR